MLSQNQGPRGKLKDFFRFLKKRKGFTLIELLVVIAIIGILATIVIYNVLKARAQADDAKVLADTSQLSRMAEMAYSEGNPAVIPPSSLVPGDPDNSNPDLGFVQRALAGSGYVDPTVAQYSSYNNSIALISNVGGQQMLTANPRHPRYKSDRSFYIFQYNGTASIPTERYYVSGRKSDGVNSINYESSLKGPRYFEGASKYILPEMSTYHDDD